MRARRVQREGPRRWAWLVLLHVCREGRQSAPFFAKLRHLPMILGLLTDATAMPIRRGDAFARSVCDVPVPASVHSTRSPG